MSFDKRGISPVIATVLLVGLAVIIAFVIFLWAKSTLAEQYLKFSEPVDRACELVNFDSEIFMDGTGSDATAKFSVVNKGNIPLYGFKMYDKGSGSLKEIRELQCRANDDSGLTITLGNGESCTVSGITEVEKNDVVLVVPQILAERGNQEVPYTCDKSFGDELDVG